MDYQSINDLLFVRGILLCGNTDVDTREDAFYNERSEKKIEVKIYVAYSKCYEGL